jgi:hypothetical protein
MAKKIEDTLDELVETPAEEIVVETPQVETPPAPAPVITPATYVAVDGDSYASIAAKHKPAGTSTHLYAKTLFALNGGKNIVPGTEVKVK